MHVHVWCAGPSDDCLKPEDQPCELPVLERLALRNCQHRQIEKLIKCLLVPPAEEPLIGLPRLVVMNILKEVDDKVE